MRTGRVIGQVTLSSWHPTLKGARWPLVVPLTWEELQTTQEPHGEELVMYDDLGAGVGSLVAFSEGGEAAQPFLPEPKPIDAYNAAILDKVEITVNKGSAP